MTEADVLMDKRDRFAVNLRRARQDAGISQEELAERCELHRTEVSLLERGGREPRLGTMIKLATALGTNAEALWGSAGTRKRASTKSTNRASRRSLGQNEPAEATRQQFFDDVVGRAEEAVDIAEETLRVVDDFDRLFERDLLDSLP